MSCSLLLRFAGPQQSWGSTELSDRNTEPVPTRSGVIGMLAAALGVPRDEWPDWLWATEVWARVDRKGELSTDFHTVGAPSKEVIAVRTRHRKAAGGHGDADFIIPLGGGSGWKLGGGTMVTYRQYLADAEFLIAITHTENKRLDQLSTATRNPTFMTYLGRKSFAPTFPFHLGMRDGHPHEILASLPTRSDGRRGLSLHQLLGDRNYATETVHPPLMDSMQGWAA